jgi:uncharacterized protein (DUF2126 family)
MNRQFEGKKDSKFTLQESKDILNYLLDEYYDEKNKKMKMNFDEMICGVAQDLGLLPQQFRDALSHPSVIDIVEKLELAQNQIVQANKNLITEMKKPFAYKTDLKFTAKETEDIWIYAHKEYMDKTKYKSQKFDDMIKGVAQDLGLTAKQVRAAFNNIGKKEIKELERIHNELVKNHNNAIRWVRTADYPKIIRFLKLTTVWTWIKK